MGRESEAAEAVLKIEVPGLIWGLPSQGSQPREEISITLRVKTRGDSGCLGETEGD